MGFLGSFANPFGFYSPLGGAVFGQHGGPGVTPGGFSQLFPGGPPASAPNPGFSQLFPNGPPRAPTHPGVSQLFPGANPAGNAGVHDLQTGFNPGVAGMGGTGNASTYNPFANGPGAFVPGGLATNPGAPGTPRPPTITGAAQPANIQGMWRGGMGTGGPFGQRWDVSFGNGPWQAPVSGGPYATPWANQMPWGGGTPTKYPGGQ